MGNWEADAVTNAEGWFTCDRVVAGRLVIDRVFARGAAVDMVNGLACTIEVRTGDTTRVALGGPGRTVLGRFEAPGDLAFPIDWSRVHVRLGLFAPHIGLPGDDDVWRVYGAFLDSEEGKAYYRDGLPVGGDGSFRIEGVPTGHFQLFIWVPGAAVGKADEKPRYYAIGTSRVEVEPGTPGQVFEPLSLGTIILHKSAE
jgi:hypothetical protein